MREVGVDGAQIGFELDNESVVWGDGRKVRKAIAACGLRVGDVIDYTLEDSGGLAGFRLIRGSRPRS